MELPWLKVLGFGGLLSPYTCTSLWLHWLGHLLRSLLSFFLSCYESFELSGSDQCSLNFRVGVI